MIGKLFRAGLAGLVIAFTVWGADASRAANVTPDQLTSDTSPQNTDLLVIWPTGGPLKSLQWSLLVSQVGTSLGGTFLTKSLNLSDVPSPSTARNNLGLGTAAPQNTGTSGANLPFLNGANTWSGEQSFMASASGGAGVNFAQGAAPTSPNNGDCWTTTASWFCRLNGTTDQFLIAGNNLSELASASTARTNLGLGNSATENVGTGAGTVAAGNDSRFAGPTQNVQCGSPYTLVASDAGAQIYCNTAGAHTTTIPANGSVAFAIGTKEDIVNDCSAGAMTISITTDTLVLFPTGSTGSRTLAACGEATATKVNTTRWIITGSGLSWNDLAPKWANDNYDVDWKAAA